MNGTRVIKAGIPQRKSTINVSKYKWAGNTDLYALTKRNRGGSGGRLNSNFLFSRQEKWPF